MENSYILAFEVLYQCNERVINLHGGHEGCRRERKITSLSARIAIIPPIHFCKGLARRLPPNAYLKAQPFNFALLSKILNTLIFNLIENSYFQTFIIRQ